jgi:hypothetical protein
VITSEPDVHGNASSQQLSTTYNALRSCWRSAAFLCNGMSILLPYHLLANSLTRRRSSLFLLMYLLGMSITLPYHVRADSLSRLRSCFISIMCVGGLLLFTNISRR